MARGACAAGRCRTTSATPSPWYSDGMVGRPYPRNPESCALRSEGLPKPVGMVRPAIPGGLPDGVHPGGNMSCHTLGFFTDGTRRDCLPREPILGGVEERLASKFAHRDLSAASLGRKRPVPRSVRPSNLR